MFSCGTTRLDAFASTHAQTNAQAIVYEVPLSVLPTEIIRSARPPMPIPPQPPYRPSTTGQLSETLYKGLLTHLLRFPPLKHI